MKLVVRIVVCEYCGTPFETLKADAETHICCGCVTVSSGLVAFPTTNFPRHAR